jgi:hypothetical protein
MAFHDIESVHSFAENKQEFNFTKFRRKCPSFQAKVSPTVES